MPQKFFIGFGKYLREKPNFIKVAGTAFGLIFGAALLWMFGRHGGIGWWLFLVALVIPASWIWALCMWLVFEKDIKRISSISTQEQKGPGSN
jgi:hypothetical protein